MGNGEPRGEQREWRQAVLVKCQFRCECCHRNIELLRRIGRQLHAHHLYPWVSYPHLRYDVANGIALCEMCHKSAHGDKESTWVFRKTFAKRRAGRNKRRRNQRKRQAWRGHKELNAEFMAIMGH